MGENPRKGKLTEMAGTNPKIFGGSGAKRFGGGMTHDTAPNKDHPDLFTPGIGFAGPGADEPV
jgi:hypothetical protein